MVSVRRRDAEGTCRAPCVRPGPAASARILFARFVCDTLRARRGSLAVQTILSIGPGSWKRVLGQRRRKHSAVRPSRGHGGAILAPEMVLVLSPCQPLCGGAPRAFGPLAGRRLFGNVGADGQSQ